MNGYVQLLKPFRLTALVLLLLCVTACRSKSKKYEPTYSVDSMHRKTLLYGVPTQAYYEMHSAFVKYLNDHLKGINIQIVASSNFSTYVDKVNKRFFDLAIANGIMVVDGKNIGYSLAGESVGEEPNAGVILVNKDSLIQNFSDLKGRSIASIRSPALQGHMLQMVYLVKQGLNVNKQVKLKYLESFESVILNIYLGKCSAGFASISGWHNFLKKRPEVATKVAVKWMTQATEGNTLLIRNDLNEETTNQIKNLVLNMHRNEDGRKALADIGYTKFIPADSTTYLPLRSFLIEYRKLIVEPK
jgi:phosphonate transport system substrate-binding protein